MTGVDNATDYANTYCPRDFREQFDATFLQLFKVLKDRCYYIATGATSRSFSYYTTSTNGTLNPINPSSAQYNPMYTVNGTKPSVFTRTFKFKIKQPLTFNQDS